ncbi:MAG: sulfatase-like hydrolase/transferase, partial [Cetobacterium sp.]
FYKNRYPENYEVYKTDDIILKSSSANKEILKYYNNSILYGDYVLDKIFESLNEYEGIAFYLSDHGEELYENGFAGHYGKGGNKWMLEIPLFIYPTDRLKIKYPEKVEELKSSKNRPYMTDDFIHTFLDVLDIKTQDFDETRSIINSNFNMNRRRIYDGKDYDSELKLK